MKADNDMGVKSREVSNSGLHKFFSLHDIDYVTTYLRLFIWLFNNDKLVTKFMHCHTTYVKNQSCPNLRYQCEEETGAG
jgi:hypothetical protein